MRRSQEKRQYKRTFKLCPNQRRCKLVSIGQCDRHPDCDRGVKCPHLWSGECSFYHPPEHFRLIQSAQTAVTAAMNDNNSASPYGVPNDVYGPSYVPKRHSPLSVDCPVGRKQVLSPQSNGSSPAENPRRFYSKSRKWQRKNRSPKKKQFRRGRGRWTLREEEELLRYADEHNIREDWIPGTIYHDITTRFGRSVEQIKSCLLRLRCPDKFNRIPVIPPDPQTACALPQHVMRNTISPFEDGQIPQFDTVTMTPTHHPPSIPIPVQIAPQIKDREKSYKERGLHRKCKPWRDFEDDYIVDFVKDKCSEGTLSFEHVQEMKQHLHRSLFAIKSRFEWLRQRGRFGDVNGGDGVMGDHCNNNNALNAVNAVNAPKQEKYHPQSHTHSHSIAIDRDPRISPLSLPPTNTISMQHHPIVQIPFPTLRGGAATHQQIPVTNMNRESHMDSNHDLNPRDDHSTPSPKEQLIQIQSAIQHGSDYSVSVPTIPVVPPMQLHSSAMPTTPGSDYNVSVLQQQQQAQLLHFQGHGHCLPQRLPALISDIKINDHPPASSGGGIVPTPMQQQRIIPPPPPPRRNKESKGKDRKRKFNEITTDSSHLVHPHPVMQQETMMHQENQHTKKRKMMIADLSVMLSHKMQEGSNLLESMNTRIPDDTHTQEMYIQTLKKQIAWIRKVNLSMHQFQKGHTPKLLLEESKHTHSSTTSPRARSRNTVTDPRMKDMRIKKEHSVDEAIKKENV